ncbi:hypothetical protein CB1_000529005 [Camelus ferus]|nr:hypothetical protein CB1_000529005 [Camelus ferus]
MKSSKSSTSLAFESRLSKLKRASSEDMLNKPGAAAAPGAVRLKKTTTSGAISELTESRLRSTGVAFFEVQAGWCGSGAASELHVPVGQGCSRNPTAKRGPALSVNSAAPDKP